MCNIIKCKCGAIKLSQEEIHNCSNCANVICEDCNFKDSSLNLCDECYDFANLTESEYRYKMKHNSLTISKKEFDAMLDPDEVRKMSQPKKIPQPYMKIIKEN